MASQLTPGNTIGNFKPPRKDRGHKQSNAVAERPGMSEEHCAAIRKCPCTACLKIPAGEIHHLKSQTGTRGMGIRSTDKFGVSLCRQHHDEIERSGTKNEAAKFQSWGIADVLDLAAGLWAVSPDVPKMTKVIIANKTGKP
jgi:hypothetical protein